MAIKRLLDPVLTELSRGYTNAEYVAEALFPRVNVDKETGKIPQFGKEAFALYNTERAMGAKSNRMNPEGLSTIPFSMDEHDIEYPVDHRQSEEVDLPIESNATNTVMGIIRLRHEKKSADLATDPANYSATNKIALSGSSMFSDPTSDPIAIIKAGKEAVRAKIGKRPNTMVISASVFDALAEHPKLLAKIQYVEEAIITVDTLKRIFKIDNIVVGEAVYADDKGVFHDVWGKSMVLAYVTKSKADARSQYEPSFAYTIGKKGYSQVDTYVESGGKIKVIRATDILTSKIVGADAGYLISNAVA